LVRDLRLAVLQDVYHLHHLKYNIVQDFTLKQVQDFAGDFFGELFIQGLVQGNFSASEALKVDETVRSTLSSAALSSGLRELRCNTIPQGANIIRVKGLDDKNANSLITNYYQSGPGDLVGHAVLETLCKVLEEPVFDTLRTKEQLGYNVSSCLRNTQGVLGLSVTVNTQANKFSVEHCDQRIEHFLRELAPTLLTQEELNSAVTALTKRKTRADVTLEEEVDRHWNEVVSREYFFDRAEKEVELLASLKLEDLNVYLDKIVRERKLSVQVEGAENPDSGAEPTGQEAELPVLSFSKGEGMVADIEGWKESLVTHPVIYITK